jgi:hypothetical protein
MIRCYQVDLATGAFEVELVNGKRLRTTADPKLAQGLTARSLRVDLESRELEIVLPDGRLAVFELGRDGVADVDAQTNPVVYLDQLHWITLAQQLRSPAKVRGDNAAAAAKLVRYAHERRITLPFASSHLTEAPVAGNHRRDLAATVFALSRGWQMRSPLDVRRQELSSALAGDRPRAEDVFTLEPGAVFVSSRDVPNAPRDFPALFQDLYRRLTSVSALYESMIDDRGVDKTQSARAASKWATAYGEMAARVQATQPDRAETRRVALAALTSDLQLEIAGAASQAGIQAARFARWMSECWEADLAQMPYTGRLFEVTYERLRNAEDKWQPNDLIDMQYLCLAAGYAGIVVTERKMSDLIRRANARLPAGAFVCRTLPSAVEHLESQLLAA